MALRIDRLPLSSTPASNISCSVWYRINDGQAVLLTTSLVITPQGFTLTPFFVNAPTVPGDKVTLIVKSNCGTADIEKDFIVPQPITQVTTAPAAPVVSWQCTAARCEVTNSCPAGYTLSPDGTICTKVESSIPVQEAIDTNAAPSTNPAYSSYGTRVYEPGYNLLGDGVHTVLTTSHWINTSGTGGPMNRNAVWIDENNDGVRDPLVAGAELPISFRITASTTKDFYFGLGGDNYVKLIVNGTTIVDKSNFTGDNFRWWHIYPVSLHAGENLVTIIGKADGSVNDAVALEVYENTKAEILTATSDNTLTIRYKTGDLRGGTLNLSVCPEGYQPIYDGGAWVCQRVLSMRSHRVNTGYVVCDTRGRYVNGKSDGYTEPNIVSGEGPFFPPVLNPDACPINSVDIGDYLLINNAGDRLLINNQGDRLLIKYD